MYAYEEGSGKRSWMRRLSILAAVLIAAVIVGSLITVLRMTQIARQPGGATAGPGNQTVMAAPTPAAPKTFPGMYLGVSNQVVKLDVQTHKVMWRYTVKNDPKDIPAFQQPQVHYQPVVAGDNVYFTAQNGRLYDLDARTGVLRWQRNFQAYLGQQYVVDNVLYVSTDWSDEHGTVDDVYALDPANGATKMKYKTSGSIAGIYDGVMYVSMGNTLTALHVSDGSQLWQAQFDTKQDLNPEVYLRNDLLYASSLHISEKTANEPQDSYVYTLDPQNGKVTWKSPMMDGFVFHIAVGDDGRVYCGAQNHYVYAFDPKTNAQLWKYRTITGHVYPAPIVQDGVVYVGQSSAGNGILSDHLVALDAANGQQKWAVPLHGYTGIGDNDPLAFYNGTVYLGVSTGLVSIAANDGKQRLAVSTDVLLGNTKAMRFLLLDGIAITIVS